MINTKSLVIQNYGSSLLVFISGATPDDAYNDWLDLFNFGSVGTIDSKPNYVADNVIACWTTEEKLMQYYFMRYVFRLADTKPNKGVRGGNREEARNLALATYEAIVTESFRSVNSNFEVYEMGTIAAEREGDELLRVNVPMSEQIELYQANNYHLSKGNS